jgi:predicted RNase H-related nuclease YkuK (DUF458 family)
MEKIEKKLIFKKISGEVIENVETYVKNWIKENPYGKVIIGCDSQMHGRRIKYSIAIVMHYIDRMGSGHGGHVIVADSWEKRITKSPLEEIPSKLWREAEYVLAAAQMVDGADETFKKRIVLHLDFNNEAESNSHENLSNAFFASGLGYLIGMGYAAEGKPTSYVATHTADHFCR